MPRHTRRNLVMNFAIVGASEPVWSISGGGNFDEGVALNFSVAVDSTDVTYVGGETISIDFRAQATPSPPGTWNYSGIQMLSDAVAALNLATPGSATINGQTITFVMAVWNGTIAFVRQSYDNPAEQGDFNYSWTIENPTRGTISGSPTISGTINDATAGPPTGLTGLAFSGSETTNGVVNIFIPTTTVADTLLTNVTGIGGTLTTLAFDTGGSENGLLKLVGNSLYSNGVLNFERINTGTGQETDFWGKAAYYATLIGNPGVDEIRVQLRIDAHFPKILPTGSLQTNIWNGISPSILTYPNFKNWSGDQGFISGFKKVVVSPSVIGAVVTGSSGGGGPMPGSGMTLIGHKKISFYRGGGFVSGDGQNNIFYDVAFRPGSDLDGYPFDGRDCGEVRHGKNWHFKNCSFTWAIDELISCYGVSPHPRHIRFERCLFAQALIQGGHSKGNHGYGPISRDGCMDIVYDKCVFLGMNQRNPWTAVGRGMLLQNCIIGRFGATGVGGSMYLAQPRADGTLNRGPLYEFTAIVRGNLYQNFNATSHLAPITVWGATGVGPDCWKIYVSEGAKNDQNHFFTLDATMGGVPNLANDPITRAANIKRFQLNEEGFACADEPFRTDMDSELMPTDTPANRLLMWDDVMGNVGVRNDGTGVRTSGLLGMTFIDYESVKEFLDTGNISDARGQFPNGPPPAAAVPSNRTDDFDKVTMLPPGASAWPV